MKNKDVHVVKIKNTFNVSDPLTKPHDRAFMHSLVELLDHYYEEGRPDVAPHLDLCYEHHHLLPEYLLLLGLKWEDL